MLLTSISISGESGDPQDYDFEYIEPSGSSLFDTYADQWGYYKDSYDGKPEGTITEKGIFLHKEFKGVNYLSYSGLSFGTHLPFEFIWRGTSSASESHNLVDRSTNNSRALHFFSLTKVKYPTKGYTEYHYEPNKYQGHGTVVYGNGQRIKKIISNPADDGQSIITEYKYGENDNGLGVIDIPGYRMERFYTKQSIYIETIMEWIYSNPVPVDYFYREKMYSTTPYQADFQDLLTVSYPRVSIREYDGVLDKYNGKTISLYHIPSKTDEGIMDGIVYRSLIPSIEQPNVGNYYISKYRIGVKPYLMSRYYYDENEDLIEKNVFDYETISSEVFKGVRSEQKVRTSLPFEDYSISLTHPYIHVSGLCAVGKIETTLNCTRLKSKNTISYLDSDSITVNEVYDYNGRNQVSKIHQKNSSDGEVLLTRHYKYPADYSDRIYQTMVSKNLLSPIVEEYTVRNNLEINRKKTNYTDDYSTTKGLILPQSIETAFGTENLKSEVVFDLYDKKGNILQYTRPDGVQVSYLWSYNYQYPIAEIQNASYGHVSDLLSNQGINLDALATSLNPAKSTIDRVKSFLKGFHSVAYTYKPLVGIKTITDQREHTLYYDYDNLNRIKEIYNYKDNAKEILKAYEYHYSNR